MNVKKCLIKGGRMKDKERVKRGKANRAKVRIESFKKKNEDI